MKVGFKTGPKTWPEGKEIINRLGARYCELWFRYDQKEKFFSMLVYLQKKKVNAGLHFWAMLPDGTFPNLAFDSGKVVEQTREFIKGTIDIAAKHHFHYVVVHPGSRKLIEIDFEKNEQQIKSEKITPLDLSNKILFENCFLLDRYAQKRGVLFLMETILKLEPTVFYKEEGRFSPIKTLNVSLDSLISLAQQGLLVANDLSHTAMNIISDDRQFLFEQLIIVTKKLAKQTKLLHVNTTRPPFNGADTHNGILLEDFKKGVFPNREQLKILLALFKNRDDVWLIPEPFEKMGENYLALKELVGEIA